MIFRNRRDKNGSESRGSPDDYGLFAENNKEIKKNYKGELWQGY
jgi:hypothetical protein